MGVVDNIAKVKKELPEDVTLIAVSKFHPSEMILEAYNGGQRIFGENRVQEMVSKYDTLPKDIEWHLIGHLQTNKVKYIASFVSMIQSVDSLELLKQINLQAAKHNRIIDCLLQFHVAAEVTKFGLTLDEAKVLLSSEDFLSMKNVRICGVMGMATNTDNIDIIHSDFKKIHTIFNILKNQFFAEHTDSFKVISMGMSSDYDIAIEEGSTMVRIGTALFGARV